MPTPQGDITASDIWRQQQEDNPPAEETTDEPGVQVPASEVQED